MSKWPIKFSLFVCTSLLFYNLYSHGLVKLFEDLYSFFAGLILWFVIGSILEWIKDQFRKNSKNKNSVEINYKTKPKEQSFPDHKNHAAEILCPNCLMIIQGTDIICEYCNFKLKRNCPMCDHENSIGASFCSGCGLTFETNKKQPNENLQTADEFLPIWNVGIYWAIGMTLLFLFSMMQTKTPIEIIVFDCIFGFIFWFVIASIFTKYWRKLRSFQRLFYCLGTYLLIVILSITIYLFRFPQWQQTKYSTVNNNTFLPNKAIGWLADGSLFYGNGVPGWIAHRVGYFTENAYGKNIDGTYSIVKIKPLQVVGRIIFLTLEVFWDMYRIGS